MGCARGRPGWESCAPGVVGASSAAGGRGVPGTHSGTGCPGARLLGRARSAQTETSPFLVDADLLALPLLPLRESRRFTQRVRLRRAVLGVEVVGEVVLALGVTRRIGAPSANSTSWLPSSSRSPLPASSTAPPHRGLHQPVRARVRARHPTRGARGSAGRRRRAPPQRARARGPPRSAGGRPARSPRRFDARREGRSLTPFGAFDSIDAVVVRNVGSQAAGRTLGGLLPDRYEDLGPIASGGLPGGCGARPRPGPPPHPRHEGAAGRLRRLPAPPRPLPDGGEDHRPAPAPGHRRRPRSRRAPRRPPLVHDEERCGAAPCAAVIDEVPPPPGPTASSRRPPGGPSAASLDAFARISQAVGPSPTAEGIDAPRPSSPTTSWSASSARCW